MRARPSIPNAAIALLLLMGCVAAVLAQNNAPAAVPAGSLAGTVRDAKGNAITGATITAVRNRDGKKTVTFVDSTGNFSLPSLDEADYTVNIGGPSGFLPRKFESVLIIAGRTTQESVVLSSNERIDVPIDTTNILDLINITPVSRNTSVPAVPATLATQGIPNSLSGKVHDPTNALIPGAAVKITNTQTKAETRTTTDASGVFAFQRLDPGEYTMEASLQGFRTFQVQGIQVKDGESVQADAVLGLASRASQQPPAGPTGSLSGKVYDRSGALVRKATITLSNPATNTDTVVHGDDTGRFTFTKLDAGEYTITTFIPGLRSERIEGIRIPANTNLHHDIVLRAN